MSYRDDNDRRWQREDRQQGDTWSNEDYRGSYGQGRQHSAFSSSGNAQQGGREWDRNDTGRDAGLGRRDAGAQRDAGYGRQEDVSRASGFERDWGHDYNRDERRGGAGGYGSADRVRDASGADWGAQRDNTRRFSEAQYDAGRHFNHGYGDWDIAGSRRGGESGQGERYAGSGGYGYGYGYGGGTPEERERDGSGRRTGMGGSAYGSSSGHSGPQGRGRHPDPDYHKWREEQIRNLDNDYDSWRQERYSKFADEFSTWRNARSQQGGSAASGPGAASSQQQASGARNASANTGSQGGEAQNAQDTDKSASPSSRQQQQK